MLGRSVGLVVLLLCLFTLSLAAQEKAAIEGVWQLTSQKIDGKESAGSRHMVKAILNSRFLWVAQDREQSVASLARKTQGDSVAAYVEDFNAGEGRYKLAGDTYSETIEMFRDPVYIGKTVDFTVRIDGDHLSQTGRFPVYENGVKTREVQLEEEYTRVR